MKICHGRDFNSEEIIYCIQRKDKAMLNFRQWNINTVVKRDRLEIGIVHKKIKKDHGKVSCWWEPTGLLFNWKQHIAIKTAAVTGSMDGIEKTFSKIKYFGFLSIK